MKLVELIPDPSALLALEPEELGLRLLRAIAELTQGQRSNSISVNNFVLEVATAPPYGAGGRNPRPYPEVETALREAWAWLEGAALLIPDGSYYGRLPNLTLSRRARRLAEERDPSKVFTIRRIARDSLHPSIREDVWALYHRSKYDTAVFEAMKAVEVAVREAAGLEPQDIGTELMRKAFHPNTGPLHDPRAPPAEREARAHLFAGATGSYKNPQSHRRVDLNDPDEAAEIIMLANHLLRIVDTRREASSETSS